MSKLLKVEDFVHDLNELKTIYNNKCLKNKGNKFLNTQDEIDQLLIPENIEKKNQKKLAIKIIKMQLLSYITAGSGLLLYAYIKHNQYLDNIYFGGTYEKPQYDLDKVPNFLKNTIYKKDTQQAILYGDKYLHFNKIPGKICTKEMSFMYIRAGGELNRIHENYIDHDLLNLYLRNHRNYKKDRFDKLPENYKKMFLNNIEKH